MKTEQTSNPNILKFIASKTFYKGSKEYTDPNNTTDFPLAGQLLQFPFIKSVLIMGDFIAIEKLGAININWSDVKNDLSDIISKGIEDYIFNNNKKIPVEVYIEKTPNPESIKFITNTLLHSNIAEATSSKETDEFPLAKKLFELPYIKEVFVNQNYISITKKENENWDNYLLELRDFISLYLKEGKPVVTSKYTPFNKDYVTKNYSDLELEIKKILDQFVKPAVANDGGNIEFLEFEEKTKPAKMLLQGACNGCPSSTVTLKTGIETMLKEMLEGQVQNVVAINE